ncbi:MAG: peptidoglycan bridge formation protein FemAB, partial [Mariniphaga sp.]
MFCQLAQKDIEVLKTTNILPQTPFWGRIKHSQGYMPEGFELTVSKEILDPSANEQVNVNDDLLVFIKYINDSCCFAYVPYGPKLEPEFENQGLFLEELSEMLRSYLPKCCAFIRYDLKWQNQWARESEYFDSSGNWMGPPESNVQEFRVNFKTVNWNLRKSPVDVLPKNTFFLDLTPGEDELLYNMR